MSAEKEKKIFNRGTAEIGNFHTHILKPRQIRLTFKLGGETITGQFHRIRVQDEVEYREKWDGIEKHGPKECLEVLNKQCGFAKQAVKDKLAHALEQLKMGVLTHDDIRQIGAAVDKLIAASWPEKPPLSASVDEMSVYLSMYGGDWIAQRVGHGLMTREELLAAYSEVRLIKLEEAAIAAGAPVAQARAVLRQPTPLNGHQEIPKAKAKLEVVGPATASKALREVQKGQEPKQ